MTAPDAPLPRDAAVLRAAADRLEAEAARATGGRWELTGLLATRPEVVARDDDGRTAHVAEARAGTARWIALCSPALAAPLAAWLRAAAEASEVNGHALDVAGAVLGTAERPGPPFSL